MKGMKVKVWLQRDNFSIVIQYLQNLTQIKNSLSKLDEMMKFKVVNTWQLKKQCDCVLFLLGKHAKC